MRYSKIPTYITQSYGICVECLCKRILEFMSTSKVPHIKNYKCLSIHTQHGLFGCNKFQIKGLLNFFKVLPTHITICLTFNIYGKVSFWQITHARHGLV